MTRATRILTDTLTGKPIRVPAHMLVLSTDSRPFVRQHMNGHRDYIDPVPFTRPSLRGV